jgi:hypothetical protein
MDLKSFQHWRERRWKCRSDGKHGSQDDEAVQSPTLPTDLGNRQRTAISHISTARLLLEVN